MDIFVVVDNRDAALVGAIQDVALKVDLQHLTYLESIRNVGRVLWIRDI